MTDTDEHRPGLSCRPCRIIALLFMLAISNLSCGSSPPPASARARSQVNVTLFATAWCPVCAQARRWLYDRAIPFDELNVETNSRARRRLIRLNPRANVPTLLVDGQLLIGFSSSDLRSAIDRAAQRYE